MLESVDRPALESLPDWPYEYAERKSATVNINYHVTFNNHCYSIPYTLIDEVRDVKSVKSGT
ncbi:MAG: hypothetical protein R6T90_03400 [Dissulfuribacterales bacterium]